MKQVFFVPERGDVVWISLSPIDGQRQVGRRPAVVLSPQAYNARVGLAVLCPITPHVKGYPFEVLVPAGLPVEGAILADQAISLDWRTHRAEKICSLPSGALEKALGKIRALLS
jgi:mRNA interferase MazF